MMGEDKKFFQKGKDIAKAIDENNGCYDKTLFNNHKNCLIGKETYMNLNILEIKELESGGAELIIDMDSETKKYLINFAIIEMIKRELLEITELHEKEYKDED